MISIPILVIRILLLFGGTYGDSVTQTEGPITLSEGTSLTLNCSYQTSGAPYLFWYVQYPKGNLKLLLRETSGKDQEEDKNGFGARKIKEKSLFYLEKASVQMGDSAVYYCVLSGTVMKTIEGAEHKFCEIQETSCD
uniref:Ig-like domain-containing protein n=1 Tax=Sarcophilus harrisii TaxID=9305 RepID=G3VRB7_SARHA